MKRFIPLLLVLLLLANGTYAINLDIKAINGTEFTLLSNTEECLVDCEAWILWDLTQGITTDVQIPTEKTSQFNFELIKEKNSTKELESFGIEVWEEIKGKWEKVSDNFYGFKAIKGKVYRLRIWGKRNASLEKNAIDWVPTFFGETISEWAWWNSSWKNKQKITLNTQEALTANVTKDTVIFIDINSVQTDFWAKVKSDGSDIRFVSGDETIAYDYHFEGFDYAGQDLNAWVKVTQTFTTGASGDTNIFVYYGNTGATDAQNESGTYPANYTAVYHMNDNNTAGQTNSTEDGNFLTHINSPTVNTDGIIGTAVRYVGTSSESSAAEDDLMFTQTTAYSISLWHMSDSGGGGEPNGHIVTKTNVSDEDRFFLQWNASSKIDFLSECANGGATQFQSVNNTWNAGEWYHIVMTIDTVGNLSEMYVNGNKALGGSATLAGGTCAEGNTTPFKINVSAGGGEFGTQHIDEVKVFYGTALTNDDVNLMYATESGALITFGEPEFSTTDLNISTINGIDFKTHPIFAFGIDGNITLDFNVFQKDNERLTIDLNYSTNDTEGSGTNIVKDLNLTSDICVDQDWSDEPSECSVSWNFSSVADGNYVLIGKLNAISTGDFNSSDGNFAIANDVNLVVLVPINEETNVVIDTIISSWIVRINSGGFLSIFDNQIDVNGFPMPIDADFSLVEIDTNTPALFNSRTYSFTFNEATATITLQPYLAPVDASILTTVKTLQFENLVPIPGVRLKIFKDLAEGRTLIHDTVTDGKGESSIPFIVADIYEIEVIVNGVLIFTEEYIATATTNEHFIYISSTPPIIPPDPLSTPSVVFFPTQKHFNTIDINLGVIVSTNQSNIASIHFFITNNDFNIYEGGIDTGTILDGNTYTANINNLQDVSDNNFPFVSTVIIVLTDGNRFVFSASYSLKPDPDNPLNILIYEMRTSFGCDIENLNNTCTSLMFIAFFIILFVVAGFSIGTRGIAGGSGLALIGLILTMFFVFIMWIPLWLGIVMVFAAIGVILTRTSFIGD